MNAPRDFERLEPFRYIIVEIMRRRRLSTADVARHIGCDRTYLSKVRSGARAINPQLLEKLILFLGADRSRMVLAAVVMGRPGLYFDPGFGSLSHYVQAFMSGWMKKSSEEPINHGAALAGLPKERCELLAHQAVTKLADKFVAVDSVFLAAA